MGRRRSEAVQLLIVVRDRRHRIADDMHPECFGEICVFITTTDTPDPETDSDKSHVDRAMSGPTPDNLSLSRKTRVRRANFFDQRERQVEADEAEPLDPHAGLPERVVDGAETLQRNT